MKKNQRKTCFAMPEADRMNAEQTGRYACPKCEGGMMFLDAYATKKEFYCGKCHVSVPLFAR